MRYFSQFRKLFLVVLLVALTACDGGEEKSVVLAEVNGEAITQRDVEAMIHRLTGKYLKADDTQVRGKALESIIASRTMRSLIEKELSEEEILNKRAQAKLYEDELYVADYLRRYANPELITSEIIHGYYQQNPQEFGAASRYEFELLKAPKNLADKQRDELLKALPAIQQEKNWKQASARWQQLHNVVYQQGVSSKGLLDAELESVLASLKESETSNAIYIDGMLHLIRLRSVQQVPPLALAEVSDKIRIKLASMAMKDAVKKAAEEAREKVEVIVY